jgi:hypothetical protein
MVTLLQSVDYFEYLLRIHCLVILEVELYLLDRFSDHKFVLLWVALRNFIISVVFEIFVDIDYLFEIKFFEVNVHPSNQKID